jgi:hypothetical protein
MWQNQLFVLCINTVVETVLCLQHVMFYSFVNSLIHCKRKWVKDVTTAQKKENDIEIVF